MIWFDNYSLEAINAKNKNTLVDHIGIEITKITDCTLEGTMPADKRTHQPFGIVHGGANCVLAETLGSIAANLTCNPKEAHAVGLSITTNHIKAVRNGLVKGVASVVHKGRTTQLWEIRITNSQDQLVSLCKLTTIALSKE